MKSVWTYVVAFLVSFYTAFVAMCFWNWFAVGVLNVASISFLQMLGLIWLLSILIDQPYSDKSKWKALFTIIERCVPEEKQEDIADIIDEIQDNIWINISSKIIGNTLSLILGFVLHSFIG